MTFMNEPLEIASRAPVWEALSELFVGKELQDYDYAAIAKALRESGYSLDELEQVLHQEVAPVFRSNLSPLAVPEMEGWAQETVATEVLAHLERKPRGLSRIVKRWIPAKTLPPLANERWIKVRSLLL
ncbi:hypothetical protein FAZ69_25835 [Trinickia terrae]|uniref:DUF7079 domain-containing protein n=1 Tax=Trinickia terrae TaxID=2571161 RepID=A0A4U1HRW5_9BURK|nr:hypothetical protein [Trinickia terrae]TKC83113.1 hypothetical protein FAZ69_25835 [Trinickia terrae]